MVNVYREERFTTQTHRAGIIDNFWTVYPEIVRHNEAKNPLGEGINFLLSDGTSWLNQDYSAGPNIRPVSLINFLWSGNISIWFPVE